MGAISTRGAGFTIPSLTTLLLAGTIGTYILLAVGGSTALLDGGAACPSWPACGMDPASSIASPGAVIAIVHRLTALVVGIVLLLGTVRARRHDAARVRTATALATALYVPQIALGALAVRNESALLSVGHLFLAVVIFSLTLLALLWHLEAAARAPERDRHQTGGTAGRPSSSGVRRATATEVASPGSSDRPAGSPASTGWGDLAGAYLRLTKPRLMWLLSLVAIAAMAMAAGPALDPVTALATIVGGVLAVGASGTFNHVLERDIDGAMARTDDRPLVRDRIGLRGAIGFGVLLTLLSIGTFLAYVNLLAAGLAMSAIVYYSVIYTVVLKPNTDQNTVVGGLVGAFPALIGWAAVTGTVGLPAVVLGLVIFLWTPAHFYNLALVHRRDYERAGLPMLPVVRGEATTRRHVHLYLGATMLAAVILGSVADLGPLYVLVAVLFGGWFLHAVVRLHRERSDRAASRAFIASNVYLGAVLVVIVVDALAA